MSPSEKQEPLSEEELAALNEAQDAEVTREIPSTAPKNDEEIAQDALSSIADSLKEISAFMQMNSRHLCAIVYLMKTSDSMSPKTGITYIDDVFNAIYDDSDPFKAFDDFLVESKKQTADAAAKKAEENVAPQADA